MAQISEEAKSYEPANTALISDLERVSVNAEVVEKTYKEGTEDEFKIKVITIDGVDYRVPNTVLGNLKAILSENPELKSFKVKKDGQGINTRYTVIPLD